MQISGDPVSYQLIHSTDSDLPVLLPIIVTATFLCGYACAYVAVTIGSSLKIKMARDPLYRDFPSTNENSCYDLVFCPP